MTASPPPDDFQWNASIPRTLEFQLSWKGMKELGYFMVTVKLNLYFSVYHHWGFPMGVENVRTLQYITVASSSHRVADSSKRVRVYGISPLEHPMLA